ncbi:diguanylate cyclase [Nitratireductor sp. CAU 1489]|uniref:diguanylate cyclase n=1 Tax=Nitratireductor arenosus TaxID=2682096 RepID=A0A844QJS2_9HYPH|nr:diguanylate cyclase [Nitratireductor arenosus]
MIGELACKNERDVILSMRMDAMLNSSPASFLSVVGALIAVYVYWSPPVAIGLVLWLTCIVAVAATNLLSTILYARGLPSGWTAHSWARFVCIMHLLSGLAWGVGGGWMLSFADEHQALVTLSIGLAAVTVSIPSVVYLPAYNLFHLPIFWSYAVGLVMSSLQFNWLIAIGFFLLGAFAVAIGRVLGHQLSTALRLSIENKRLAQHLEERSAALEVANRELEIESHTDPLTGLANRRRLINFSRAVRGRCAVMIVDIDHFKSYNDSFGHVEGDACLVTVARTLVRSVRPKHDLVARLGGEEFAVVLSDVGQEGALERAEAIRANVQALQRSGPQRLRRRVTVSIGVSTREADRPKSLSDLMEEADAAVYRAKSEGRNQVCFDDSPQAQDVA